MLANELCILRASFPVWCVLFVYACVCMHLYVSTRVCLALITTKAAVPNSVELPTKREFGFARGEFRSSGFYFFEYNEV